MILEVLAPSAAIIGALLIALGALGLLRFPDVHTRIHAATKAATVGVITTTAAAAAEAGAASGVAVLLLVVALLFLSGSLGISLLARAAYHDPETPRSPRTRELTVDLQLPESTSVQQTSGTSPLLAAWLLLVWIAVFGSLRPNVVAGGAVVAAILAYSFRRLAPRWPHAFLHPIAASRFLVHFAGQLVSGTWDVTRLLGRRPDEIEPAVVDVPIFVQTRNEVTLLMNAVSFTPGTVALELHQDRLSLHVMSSRPTEMVVAEVNTMQRMIADAFGDPARRRHPSNDAG